MKRERRGPLNLLHGDIVIATGIAFYPPHIGNGRQSQEIGDMLLVNNPHPDGGVQGCSLTPGSIGLGSSLRAGTFRKAKPSDKGYVMTLQEWDRYQFERLLRGIWNYPFYIQLVAAATLAMWLIEKFT